MRRSFSTGTPMPSSTLTIRNLDANVRLALQARARSNGRSMEAEARLILDNTARPPQRPRLGDAMAAIGRKFDISNDEIDQLQAVRERESVHPVSFE
jgi:plasmid stability protein